MMIRMMSVSCMTCVVMRSDELFIPYAVGLRKSLHLGGRGGDLLRGAADARAGVAHDAESRSGARGQTDQARGLRVSPGQRGPTAQQRGGRRDDEGVSRS